MKSPLQSRRGVTLIELMVALILLGLVSTSLMQIIRSQIHFTDAQGSANQARYISRASLNLLLSDVRMVDADSGIVMATPDSFTVVAPYATGIVCGTSTTGTASVIALLPYDSVAYSEGGYSGYAYVDTTTTGTAFRQVYQYKFGGPAPIRLDSASVASSAPCNTSNDVVRIFQSSAVAVQPVAPVQAQYQAAMLVRRITYAFRPSASVIGSRGLFRTVLNGTHGSEEIAAPFDTSARFMYYLNTGAKSTSVAGASLNTIRGIELQLNGKSDHTVQGASRPEAAPLTTAIFFKNRPVQ